MATATAANGNGQIAPPIRDMPPAVRDWLTAAGLIGDEVGPVDSLREAIELLRRPFTPEAVRFKVQSTWKKDNQLAGAMVVTYIDARLVIERLNKIVPDLWSPRYERDGNYMWCYLTVDGIERGDVGEGVGKGLVSDSLKRAAVHFGVGVSLYATPKMFFDASGHGYLKAARSSNGPTLKLTPRGEDQCREIYTQWLESTGIKKFGEPLDHGDALESAGDIETEEDEIERSDGDTGSAPESSSADAVRDEQDHAAEQPQTEPAEAPAAETEPAAPDPESELAELLSKKSTLKAKRAAANAGMEKLGAGAVQRLREIRSAPTGKDLDALIARVNNAMNGGGSR